MTDHTQTHYRTCNLCESLCGLEIKHQDETIISIKGNKNDVFSKGHICPKATALQDIHFDEDRLKQPVKRVVLHNDEIEWQPITWDEAFETIGQNLREIQRLHGHDAVSFFYGTPMGHNYTAQLMMGVLRAALKSKNVFSSVSLDSLPIVFTNKQMFGNQALIPVPDLDRTEFMICLGANPIVSNGSVMGAGDMMSKLRAIKSRKGKLVTIDPRYNETSKIADEHVFIKPGTDVFFLLSMIHCVFKNHHEKMATMPLFVKNLAVIESLAKDFSPEKVAVITGINADVIENLCADFCSKKSVMYCRMGVSSSEYSSLNTLLVNVFNIITGNFDRPGGVMFSDPVVNLPGIAHITGNTGSYDAFRSRVSELPEFEGELPAVAFSEEVLTEGKGQVKGLITWAANVMLSTPNSEKNRQALESLDFMVSVDYYINETTMNADIILPPLSPLEDGFFNLALSSALTRNVTQFSSPLFEPNETQKSDGDILLKLATVIGSKSYASSKLMRLQENLIHKLGYDGIINLLISISKYGKTPINFYGKAWLDILKLAYRIPMSFFGLGQGISIKDIKSKPNGMDLGALKPSMPMKLGTRDKKINLLPSLYLSEIEKAKKQLDKCIELQESSIDPLDQFTLIGRRELRSHNSWLHNSRRLVKGKKRCTVMINSTDADRLKINDKATVKVSSEVGQLILPAEVTDNIMEGVISIPNGWGHNLTEGTIKVAESVAGESINNLVSTEFYDSITGMARLSGISVSLEAV